MSMSYSTKVALARASRARAHRSKTSVVSGTKRQDHKEYIEKNAEKMISDVEDIQEEIKSMRNNQTNITRLQKDMDRVMDQIELIKDKVRKNGH